MRDKIFDGLLAFFILLLIGSFIGFGHAIGRTLTERRAIAAGVAHYTVNPTNGTVTFTFIKP